MVRKHLLLTHNDWTATKEKYKIKTKRKYYFNRKYRFLCDERIFCVRARFACQFGMYRHSIRTIFALILIFNFRCDHRLVVVSLTKSMDDESQRILSSSSIFIENFETSKSNLIAGTFSISDFWLDFLCLFLVLFAWQFRCMWSFSSIEIYAFAFNFQSRSIIRCYRELHINNFAHSFHSKIAF